MLASCVFVTSFFESSLCGSNTQYLLLFIHKESTVLQKRKGQGILTTVMLAYLVILYSFDTWCIYG